MKHKCPICSKVFDTLDSFDTHIENHKNESILNETPRDNSIDYPIHNEIHHVNHEKFFDEEKFQELVDKKINSIENLDELIYRQNFVTILTDVYRKNPFCYLPYFIQFFMNGITVQQMISKFHFSNNVSYYDIVKKILDLKQKRFENQYCSNALELNLKIPNWSKIFESITDNSKFFEDELNELYFNSVIQARIFLFLTLHHEYISKNELITFCNIEKENLKSFSFIDESLEKKFQKYFEDGFEKKIDDILSDFIFKRFVTKIGINEKKFKGTLSINDIKSTIQQKLKIHDSKLSFGRLKTLVSEKHPGLNLIPGLEIFGIALDEMKRENIVNLEVKSNWKNDYYVFLNEEFQKISSEIKSLDSKNIPFKGRKINPDQFISELLELEKGDFDDGDDQVTRMAGLVLAESVKLQSPHEEILDFDFTVDLQNYAFRPEQIEAIGKLDFRPHDGREFGILHVKV
ncbi:MAG: C2H2-type zinc finger protein, partial [Candidatus Nitrosopelagicus sp.]|nr:C2H2-type zinc finger protein [Candidatus Nitrosopelagicus sp.]